MKTKVLYVVDSLKMSSCCDYYGITANIIKSVTDIMVNLLYSL